MSNNAERVYTDVRCTKAKTGYQVEIYSKPKWYPMDPPWDTEAKANNIVRCYKRFKTFKA